MTNTQPKHKPEVWSIGDIEGFRGRQILNSSGQIIACTYGHYAEECASLIAAAPELLEALQELVSHCDMNAGFQNLAKGPYHKDLLALAKKAIAKAEGRA
jgi:hypothetical protein